MERKCMPAQARGICRTCRWRKGCNAHDRGRGIACRDYQERDYEYERERREADGR